MNPNLYAFLALDIAQQRERETEALWLAASIKAGQPSRPGRLRRGAALLLASVSRGTASAVRRLDECVADDLGRTLAPAD
jgi:hypothetical protein